MSKRRKVIRVLLADDHPAMRAGIRAILEKAPDIEVVGETGEATEAQQMTANLRPQVLLLDLRMPGPPPAETVAWVRAHSPETAVLVLTAHDLNAYLARMVAAGAAGFVVKEEAPERIVEAVRRVARGEVLFCGEQLARARHWQEEVLRLLATGLHNTAIAEVLCVKIETVAYHATNIYGKLGVASRLEAVMWVRDHWPDGLPADLQGDLGEFPG